MQLVPSYRPSPEGLGRYLHLEAPSGECRLEGQTQVVGSSFDL